MAISSDSKSTGLSIKYDSPLWVAGSDSGEILWNSYSHVINALGGFWSASISFSAQQFYLENWYMNGLGRDITVYNDYLLPIWNGFVNKISIRLGSLAATRGPLMDIGNRVNLVFSTVDTTTDPPIVGIRESTGVVNDTDSQTKYGIIEKILSTGGANLTTAEQIRDVYLEENKEPETSEDITLGEMSQPSVTLECLGYVNLFELYTYTSTTTGTRAYNDRIEDVLGADPNSIFSTDYINIVANAATVSRYDNDDRTAWQVIKGIISKGDTAYNRYTFGIYDDLKAHYAVAPTTIGYYHNITDRKQRIIDSVGQEVKPWNVRPAKWLQVPDWLIGRSQAGGSLRDDPRNMFVESVRYMAPYGLSLSGNKIDTLPQVLGQLGLTGIGA